MDEFQTEEAVILEKKNKLRWADILGSAFLFAFAYLFLYILYDLATAITAAHYNLIPILFFDEIRFNSSSDAWCFRCVKVTYSIGILVMMVTGISFYLLYLKSKTSALFLRLGLLWLSLLSFTFISQRLLSAFVASEFQFRDLGSLGMEIGIVSAYFYLEKAELAAISIIGILISLAIGPLYAKPFLQTATSVYQIDIPKYRKRFLRHHLLMPALIGSGLILLAVFPMKTIPNLITFSILPIIMASIWFFAVRSTQLIRKQAFWKLWPLLAFLLFVSIVSFIHFIMRFGIPVPHL